MKRLFFIATLFSTLFFQTNVASAQIGPSTIIVSHATGTIGGTVDVPIHIENNPGIISMRLSVHFNADILEIVGVIDELESGTPKLGSSSHGELPNSNPPYILWWKSNLSTSNKTATGIITTMRFRIKDGTTPTTVPLTITYDNINDDDIYNKDFEHVNFEVVNGSVTTEATTQTYAVTWNADGGTPVPIQTTVSHGDAINAPAAMTKDGYTFGGWFSDAAMTAAVAFPINNVSGNQTFWAKWTLAVTIKFGDINGDGNVTPADATLILQYAAGLISFSPSQLIAADVNGDGFVTPADATLILQYAAGLLSKFPIDP